MHRSTELRLVDRSEWEALVQGFDDHNYRQTFAYSEAIATLSGSTTEYVALLAGEGSGENGSLLGLASVRIKCLPVIGGGLAYVSGGPLIRSETSEPCGRLERCLNKLAAEYCQRRRLVLRVAPPLGDPAWHDDMTTAFMAAGFEAPDWLASYRTFCLDIDRPLDEVRTGFAQKWRNCLNAGQRGGIVIHEHDTDHGFAELTRLFGALKERKGFEVDLDPTFYAKVQSGLPETERLVVLCAESQGQTVAVQLTSMQGDTAVYLLGVTTPEALKLKASYVLQWRTIEIAKERGMRCYDLGGIDPEGNPGVFHFKKGLNGVDISAPGPFECHTGGPRAMLTALAEKVARCVKR